MPNPSRSRRDTNTHGPTPHTPQKQRHWPKGPGGTPRWGEDRIRALTIVTLAGGLASTAFAPLTAVLAEHLSWRNTYAVLAVLLALVTIPTHALALRGPWPPAPAPPSQRHTGSSGSVTRSRPFLMLATAMTLNSFAMYAVVIALVPLLITRGASPTAAASLIALGGATTAAFAMVTGPFPLLVGIAIAAGTVRGNLTLLQATAVTDRWGTTDYGRLSGLLAAPATIASALAPFAGAALAGPLGGYPGLFTALALASAAAALLALGSYAKWHS